MQIVDAFLANDEIDLAKLRLRYMSQSEELSKVFICESPITFSGKTKPLHFTERLQELQGIHPNVEVLVIEPPKSLLEGDDYWAIEEYVRNKFLSEVKRRSPDTVIVSSQANLGDTNFRYVENGHSIEASGNYGAHLSYLGLDPQKLAQKYRAFSHKEMDRAELSSASLLAFADKYRISHTGGANLPGFGLLKVLPEKKLPSILKELHRMQPEVFDFSKSNENVLKRFLASCLVTNVVEGNLPSSEIEKFEAGKFSFAKNVEISFHSLQLFCIRKLVAARDSLYFLARKEA